MIPSTFTPKKRRAAIYVRVSTQEQKLDGYGSEAQKQQILSYIQNNAAAGLTLEGTETDWYFEDTHTGKEILRPALQKMLKGATKGKKYDTIVVWKLDRLSRWLKDLLDIFETLQKHDVGLVSVQENIDFSGAIGTLIFQMFGAIAQFERSLIHSRTRGGIIASATMGNYTGSSVPYGYKAIKNESGKGKKLALIPEEQQWVQKIFHWYIYEGLGGRQIAERLRELKVPRGNDENRPRSKKWTETIIQSLVKNSIYRGEYVAAKTDSDGIQLPKEQWVTVPIPPCVSEVEFSIAQQKRTERRGQNKSKNVYPLSGLLKDMTTWRPYTFKGKPNSKGSGRSYNRSKLQHPVTGKVYSNFSLPADTIENHIWERIEEAFKQPDQFIEKYLSHKHKGDKYQERLETSLKTVREEQAEMDLQFMRIEHAYETGVYDINQMTKKKEALNDQLVALEQRREQLEQEIKAIGVSEKQAAGLKTAAEQFKGRIENLSLQQKKIFMQFFIERIEVRREPIPNKIRMRPILTVYFRFLPDDTSANPDTGRTLEAHKKGQEVLSDGESLLSGQTPRTSYNLIQYNFTLDYYKEIIILNGRNKAVMRTYGVEVLDG